MSNKNNKMPRALSPKLRKGLFILLLIVLAGIGFKTIQALDKENHPGKYSADIISGNYEAGYYSSNGTYYYTNGTIWQRYDKESKQWKDMTLNAMSFLEDGKTYSPITFDKLSFLGIPKSPIEEAKLN